MRENLTEKYRDDAMRIFEALSHVDEELLARCEEPVEKTFVRKRPIWYYGSAVAACLCLLICGAALVNGRVFLNKSSDADCAVSLESMKEEILKVTVEDVVRAAKKIKLDTIYFLKGVENA